MSSSTSSTSRLGHLVPHRPHNTEATSASLRFWARAIGDRNPRFVREGYRSGIGGRFVGHPCWLYSVHDTAFQSGVPGLQPIIAGTCWSFHREVVIGDRVTSMARLVAERSVVGRHAGRSLVQTIDVRFVDGRGDPLATARATIFQVDPEQARASTKYAQWRRSRYTHEDMNRIEADYDREIVRGDAPLYAEDIASGQRLPGIVRGPLTSEEMVLFVGATRPVASGTAFTLDRTNRRADAFVHAATGIHETYAAGFVDDSSARELGFPAAHDYGIDRIGQVASLVANWMGDAGRLLALDVRLVAPATLGDATWFSGRITEVASGSGERGRVGIEVEGVNQRDEVTLRGTATVELPRRTVDA